MTDFETLPTFNPETTGLAEDRKAELYEVLANCVPECVEEGELNLEKLKHALALAEPNEEAEAFERFELNWAGKSQAKRLASKRTTATLVPVQGEGVNEDTTQNLLIEGDNLEVLKVLKDTYAGKVDMIYIDPPYNIDVDGVYEDDFEEPLQSYLKRTGALDEHQHITESESSSTRQSGRKHSRWLSMMYPRLQLMKQLLIRGGVICISIDDKEVASLRLLMDEIFGEDNFVASVIWERAYSPVNLKSHFSENHDFILFYSNNINSTVCNGLPRSDEANDRYSNPDNDPRGDWKPSDLSVGPAIQSKTYEITTPNGRKVLPPSGYCWRLDKEKFEEYKQDNRIWFGETGNNVPCIKRFLSEVKNSITPMTIWKYQDVGHSQSATKELKKLLSDTSVFNYPKPVGLIERIQQLYSDKNAVILDCFAGSGTTGHAVMKLNAEDGGQRQYICVQVPDPLSPKNKNQATACQFLDGIAKPRTIAEITKERLRRAGAKVMQDNPTASVDIGFKVFKLADSTIAPKHTTYTYRSDFENEARTLATQNEHRLAYSLQTDPYAIAWEVALKHGYALTEQLVPVQLGTLTGYAIFPPKPENRHALHQAKLLVLPTGVLETKDAVWAFTHALQAVFSTHHFVLWEGLFRGDDSVKRSVMDAIDTFKAQLTDLKGNSLKNSTLRIEVIRL